jgi:serine/threonine protein kinase
VSELKHAEVTVFGNPAWTAPECLKGAPFSPKSDVYAFGIIMWELVTREEPLRGLDEDEMTKFVTGGGRPKIPEDCPSAYAQLINVRWFSSFSHSHPRAALLGGESR